MEQSILTSVKKGVGGITEEDTAFDDDICMYINTVLAKLTQLGVGPKTGYHVTDKSKTWVQYFGDDDRLNMIQSFVILSVRMMFDPPTSGTASKAFEEQIRELEWRIQTQVETPGDEPEPEPNENE